MQATARTTAGPVSRRRFLGRVGFAGLGLTTAAALAGCGRGGAVARVSAAGSGMAMDMGAPGGGAAVTMSAEAMDREMLARMQAFPAATAGQGLQPLPFERDGDVKVFRLTAQVLQWEVEPGRVVDAWGYNGMVPGPVIRVREGDRVRVIVRNELPESTSVHWHGLQVPNAMDGVPGITQDPIKPGASFTYEFVAKPAGTHMYHAHHDSTRQVGMGLLGPFIVDPQDSSAVPAHDREYILVLGDGPLGYTINGKSFPATQPLTARLGERVLLRFLNEGSMIHPMHLHGLVMRVVAKDGWPVPAPWYCDTLNVAPGERYDVLVAADNPGTWAFHCHILPHAEDEHGMFGLVTAFVVQA
jgi:FtsP/CotA-like multicopper oxidase with cupredoxin domain